MPPIADFRNATEALVKAIRQSSEFIRSVTFMPGAPNAHRDILSKICESLSRCEWSVDWEECITRASQNLKHKPDICGQAVPHSYKTATHFCGGVLFIAWWEVDFDSLNSIGVNFPDLSAKEQAAIFLQYDPWQKIVGKDVSREDLMKLFNKLRDSYDTCTDMKLDAAQLEVDIKRECAEAIAIAKRETLDFTEDSNVKSANIKATVSGVKDSPVRPKRSTKRGEARIKLIAALTKHHDYAKDSCMKVEPVGNNELARLANVDNSTASAFFSKEFEGHGNYKTMCSDSAKLIASLKMLNDEFSPRILLDGKRNED